MTNGGEASERARALRKRLTGLTAARLAFAVLLMIATVSVEGSGEPFATATPRLAVVLLGGLFLSSGIFAALIRDRSRIDTHARLQLAWDLVFATLAVYLTGGVESGFVFLFGLIPLTAALIVPPREALLFAALAVITHGLLALGLYSGLVLPPTDQPERYRLIGFAGVLFSALRNTASIVFASALAWVLANRVHASTTRLRVAEETSERLERLNASILEALPSGLLTVDAEGIIVAANQSALALIATHENDVEAVVGHPISDFIPKAHELTRARMETELVTAKDQRVHILLSQTKLDTLRLFVVDDLREIAALRAAAQRSERFASLGRMAAGLAHEIRNPLGSISGAVQLVRDTPALRDEDRQLLSVVVRETDRLDDLVRTMLDVTRPVTPQRLRADLTALVREVVTVQEHGQTAMRICIDEVGPVDADMDANQMRQVLWNLIRNAVQAAPEKVVTIRVRRIDGAAELSVEDDGPGIPFEERARLFEPFFTTRALGIGLGLALVKQIIDAHDGSIEILSSASGGAKFRATIPDQKPSARPIA